MDRRKRAAMPGVQELKQIKSLPSSDFPQEDAVWPMAKCGSEKVADCDGGGSILLASCLEANHILFVKLNLRSIFNQYDTLVVGDEVCQGVQQSCFSASRSATNQDVLSVEHTLGQSPCRS